MKLNIQIQNTISSLGKRIDDLKFQLFQSFWECSPHCCLIPPVLLGEKGVKKGMAFGRFGVTVVSLDCNLLHLAGGLQAQGETLGEGASGNPTRVPEKGL